MTTASTTKPRKKERNVKLTDAGEPHKSLLLVRKTKPSSTAKTHRTKHIRPHPNFVPPEYALISHHSLSKLSTWSESLAAKGLVNPYTTCFMNSGIQALLAVPMLAQYLRKKYHSRACSAAGWCPTCTMEKLAEHVLVPPGQIKKAKPVNPNAMVKNLRSINKFFSPYDQQDAHEFIISLIDKMDETFLKGRGLDPKGLPDKVAHTTPLSQMFGGWSVQTLSCPLCRYESHTESFHLDTPIQVALGKSKFGTLEEALASMVRPGKLGCEWTCEGCEGTVDPTKQVVIAHPPETLMITFQVYDPIKDRKCSKQPRYPLTLDMSPYVAEPYGDERDRYDLVSVIRHHGHSQHSGHYYCQAKHDGKWYELNDEFVDSITASDATALNGRAAGSAYIVIYMRRPKGAASGIEPEVAPAPQVRTKGKADKGKKSIVGGLAKATMLKKKSGSKRQAIRKRRR
ncbi:Ubiquitin carboxyl-terminal hydrolase [Carpediemonas membranifera]|uniref:ubiquitinyl hydrolase 1 n=1 Tax=Carpediemonas membranifera TaxID=201153 RepID=A0A8J6E3B9_9EUKA|nr:Ubiquitin carboxyl-terminal hydrolase [Carpediemonas membranifera]|eukprot:KAG9392947.1 Ubiquitin carboxyl-terminal hydrolase [Carpediemonas membranifera]